MQDRSDVSNDGGEARSSLEVWPTLLRLAQRDVRDPSFPSLDTFHYEIARAELAGEIAEFYALGIQAIVYMADGSDAAVDYLNMADCVAVSPLEQAVGLQWRTMYQELQASNSRDNAELQAWASSLDNADDDMLLTLVDHLLNALRCLGILKTRGNDGQGGSQAA